MKTRANIPSSSTSSVMLLLTLSLFTCHPILTLLLLSSLLPSPPLVSACTPEVSTPVTVTSPTTDEVLTLTNVVCQVGKCQCDEGYMCAQLQQMVLDATRGHVIWNRGCACLTTQRQAILHNPITSWAYEPNCGRKCHMSHAEHNKPLAITDKKIVVLSMKSVWVSRQQPRMEWNMELIRVCSLTYPHRLIPTTQNHRALSVEEEYRTQWIGTGWHHHYSPWKNRILTWGHFGRFLTLPSLPN